MSIQLQPDEEALRKEIDDRVQKCRQAFGSTRIGDDVQKWIMEAGTKAHELHMALKQRGLEPRHHGYMVRNRELPADHADFYMHFHPLEDLLKFIADEHANDDPVDETLGKEFKFIVYSRRWKHDETYYITRTEDGWDIRHMSIGGPCDAGGHPFLFQIFDQDLIAYPSKLDWRLEWLWEQAKVHGLSYNDVQHALQTLADWVTETEKSAPADGVWEGY